MTDGRTQLVAPCGLDCGVCELYLCRDNEGLRSALVAKGIPECVLPCDGCREIEGKCPILGGVCATFTCAAEHNVDHCGECYSFPCSKLAPAADQAQVLPHNLKVFNLCIVARHGAQVLVEQSARTKSTYYSGKMRIGMGPTSDTDLTHEELTNSHSTT